MRLCANATVLGRSFIIEHAFVYMGVKIHPDLIQFCYILRQFGFRMKKQQHVFQPTCLTATLPQKLSINKGWAAKPQSEQERLFPILNSVQNPLKTNNNTCIFMLVLVRPDCGTCIGTPVVLHACGSLSVPCAWEISGDGVLYEWLGLHGDKSAEQWALKWPNLCSHTQCKSVWFSKFHWFDYCCHKRLYNASKTKLPTLQVSPRHQWK